MIFLIIAIILFILLIWYYRKYKRIKLPNVFLCSGAVKSGKTGLSVYLAIRTYKRNLRHWYLSNFIIRLGKRLNLKIFKNKQVNEFAPMLYSNMKLKGVKFNKFTKDILNYDVFIPNKSVVLLDEVSLLADSMLYKDKRINSQLTFFVKLFAHYSMGGTLILNTQSIQDCHYSFKRCINQYVYIHSNERHLFYTVFKLRELFYSDDGSNVNINDSDLESSFLNLIVSYKYFKYYNPFYLRGIIKAKNMQVNYNVPVITDKTQLFADELITLQDWNFILEKGD